MRIEMKSLLVCAFLVLTTPGFLPQAHAEMARDAAERIRMAAFAHPLDEAKFDAYYRSLKPSKDGFVVVEGDILLNREELKQYVRNQRPDRPKPAMPTAELIVDVASGEDNFYRDADSRHLTYAIDGSLSGQVENVRKWMTAATGEWSGACPECGVSFTEVPPGRDAFFTVRKEGNGQYLASSFFPNYPQARRYLNLDPSYFRTTIDRVGILRHEIGHILGYRHEHIRGIPGCYAEGTEWRPLTVYDPRSVMHYFCGGGGNIRLELSRSDVEGHRALYGAVPPSAGFTAPVPESQRKVLDARARAFANPTDPEALNAFRMTLPRVKSRPGFYVVEGDIILSEADIAAYVRQNAPSGSKAVAPSAELIVNRLEEEPFGDDIYPPSKRTLTYRIDARSIEPRQLERVRENMRRATLDWVNACPQCGIKFVYLVQYDRDPAPPPGNVNFTVTEENTGGAFIASSFFPHDPAARRVLILDPSYYTTTYDQVGVLRHEIGHILGYRHEHIRDVPGCYPDVVEGVWRPLTPYDARSVMHYFCGGGGDLRLELSEQDRVGHRELYSIRRPAGPVQRGDLIIRLEGGDAAKNAATVVRMLTASRVTGFKQHVIRGNETIDTVLMNELNVPGVDDDLRNLALERNKGIDAKQLREGTVIQVPDVRFDESVKHYSFDRAKPEDRRRYEQIQKTWQPLIIQPAEKRAAPDNDLVTVRVRAYRLRMEVNDLNAVRADGVARQIRESPRLANTYAEFVPLSDAAGPYYTHTFIDPRVVAGTSQLDVGQEPDLGLLIGRTEPQLVTRDCESLCPQVVLLDTVQRHPDINESLAEGASGTCANPPAAGDKQSLNKWNSKYHGTHLAGIIGARMNGFGIVGIDPQASIIVKPWEPYNVPGQYENFAEALEHQFGSDSDNLDIFVFASNWRYGNAADTPDKLPPLNEPIDRFKSAGAGTLARTIRDRGTQHLWIVAAGQPSSAAERPLKLDGKSPIGPMNLGDLENVLVVTASTTTKNPPVLLADVNTSAVSDDVWKTAPFVDVAAPGDSIPSTVVDDAAPGPNSTNAAYAISGGSSQAAAFAGGLASAMVRAWPHSYTRAPRLKLRMMVTSTPIDAPIATGVIDAGAAMLDPRKHWLRLRGETKYREVRSVKWAPQRSIFVRGVDTNTTHELEFENLRRLYRTSGGSWMIYEKTTRKVLEHDVESIQRFGPVTMNEQALVMTAEYRLDDDRCLPGAAPCFQKVESAQQIDDLLLHAAVAEVQP